MIYATPQTDTTTQARAPASASMTVLGVKVKVLQGALIHTPTNADLGLCASDGFGHQGGARG